MLLADSIQKFTRALGIGRRTADQPQTHSLKETEVLHLKWYDQIIAAGAAVLVVIALAFLYLFGSRRRVDELNDKLYYGRTRRKR